MLRPSRLAALLAFSLLASFSPVPLAGQQSWGEITLGTASFGDWRWAGPVANVAALPAGAATGTCRWATAEEELHCYTGAAWVLVTGGGGGGAADFSELTGQLADTQIADGAIDGGTGGEIADASITAADLAPDSVGASELDEAAVEAGLEAVLDLPDLQGSATPGQLGTGTPTTATFLRGDGAWSNTLTGGLTLGNGAVLTTSNGDFDILGGTGGMGIYFTGGGDDGLLWAPEDGGWLIQVGTNSLDLTSTYMRHDALFFEDNIISTQSGGVDIQLNPHTTGNVTTTTSFEGPLIGNADTATTASAGDSATAFFPAGTIEAARLPAVTAMSSPCTDAQVLGGTAAGTGVECQADATGTDSADDLSDNVLADLSNVDETGCAEDEVLTRDGAGGWICAAAAGGGASSSGTGLQYGDGAGGFTEVTSSSVSGADVTLGGPLAIGTTALLATPVTPSGASVNTDRGYMFGTSPPAGLVTEVSGQILSLAINTAQSGTRDTSKTGAMFRLAANSANVFDVLTHATGASALTSRFTVNSAGAATFNPGSANPAVTINGPSGNITFSDGIISSTRNPMHINFGSSNNDINFSNGKMLWEGDNERLCIGCNAPVATVDIDGVTRDRAQAFSIADDGAGTKAAGTLTPTMSYVECTCSDAHGCDVTLSETGAQEGQRLNVVNVSANACDFADAAAVFETPAGGISLGQYDSLDARYIGDRYVATTVLDN